MADISKRKLKQFFDVIAESWNYDLQLIQEELEQERDVRVFLRNRRSVVNSKYIRSYWNNYFD